MESPRQNFVKRLVSGVTLASAVLVFFYASPNMATSGIASLVVAMCLYEFAWLSDRIKASLRKPLPASPTAIDHAQSLIGRVSPVRHRPIALLAALSATILASALAVGAYYCIDVHIEPSAFQQLLLPYVAMATFGTSLAVLYAPSLVAATVIVIAQGSFSLVVCNSLLCPVAEARCVFIMDSSFMLIFGSCAMYLVHVLTATTTSEAVAAIVLDQLALIYVVGTSQILVNFVVFSADSETRKLIVVLLLTVWAGDSGSYLVGSVLRLYKYTTVRFLAPHLSPNKDIEGTVGGILFALSMMFLAVYLTGFSRPMVGNVLMTIVGFAFGRVGDLFESMIKRAAGVKDSSAMIPGHGGIMDRVDALLFASVVFCIFTMDNRLFH
ncbi:hypothetical protein SPRG_07150 [Saprolegnia parasitica CBS 223.65]|uniref:Phosphatidate cytidylyltransferase n=1 Tax=Saprolegnia parasitica (strain CBS 223.65) TaxID=695850 RepID=A0A067CBK3_SAPPC|nr:hypothetical protein SPRG_07150 [Saprolegnia parasitica CBS 223.65]KDO27878.1 hypothetical protein SPRG_07150 [Saprolegnia parasitica CBS 223.65]|eukprot:XP_012201335.1 hypothetical protein SPRG_07150 [Saprolegnia parasitica CBS 223.65]